VEAPARLSGTSVGQTQSPMSEIVESRWCPVVVALPIIFVLAAAFGVFARLHEELFVYVWAVSFVLAAAFGILVETRRMSCPWLADQPAKRIGLYFLVVFFTTIGTVLASFGPEIIKSIPLAATVSALFGIPVVAVLVLHQRSEHSTHSAGRVLQHLARLPLYFLATLITLLLLFSIIERF